MKQALLDQLLAAQAERRAVAVVTELATGEQRLVPREKVVDDPLAAVLDQGFRFDQSGVHKIEDREFFVQIHNPALRLVLIGAVHIAQAVIPIARGTGYAVTVIDPRGVLAEFGVTLTETTRIRVWDSTAEVRYLVIPQRPEGTEGMSEEELADLVTRDSMIGTGLALSPEDVAR